MSTLVVYQTVMSSHRSGLEAILMSLCILTAEVNCTSEVNSEFNLRFIKCVLTRYKPTLTGIPRPNITILTGSSEINSEFLSEFGG